MENRFDCLSVGELLVDMISNEYVDNLIDAVDFRRLPGGSPANMVGNLRRLGKQVGLVATVGKDDSGQFLTQYVHDLGVDTSNVRAVPTPTTLILITRSQAVSRFEPYRGADAEIVADQLTEDLLRHTRILHTTCFALSREPARSTILQAAERARANGCQLSIDANYAQKIWPDRAEAERIVDAYLQCGALAKFSEVDWERLYGYPLPAPEDAGKYLLSRGAQVVCLTLGERGCYVCTEQEAHSLPARKIDVKDTTGAGDAFWAGFLSAYLDGASLYNCAVSARSMAELKLQIFGQLPPFVDPASLQEG